MSKINCVALAVMICLVFCITGSTMAFSQEMTPEKVVAEHLKALGKPEVLAKIRSRNLQGISSVQFVQGASGNLTGGFVFASDGQKVAMASQYGDPNYPLDYFAYDGGEVTVGYIKPGQKSPIGEFIFRYNGIMKEGLLGGAWSVAWPLLDLQKSQPTLKYRETKIEGRTLHELEYRPKKSLGEMKIRLYFDEAFHHVRTEYSLRIKSDMTALPSVTTSRISDSVQSAAQPGPQQRSIDSAARPTVFDAAPDSIYTLVEKFDKFKQVGGVTLPFSYAIEYSLEGSGSAFIARWLMRSDGNFTNNAQIGPEFFRAQK